MRRFSLPWLIVPYAVAFLAYFLLLCYCDLDRPVAEGLDLRSSSTLDGLLVESVSPGSPADRAGIRVDDILCSADGRPLRSRFEWEAVQSTVRFDRPVALELRRDGVVRRAEWLVTRAPSSFWLRREGIELLLVRLVQVITLAFGLFILSRRPHDTGARIGGYLLATIGVFCLDFPYRLFDVWRSLPLAAGAVLWLPYLSTMLLPGLLLSFFLCFPGRVLQSRAAWVAVWVPALAIGVRQAWFHMSLVYRPGADRLPEQWVGWRFGVAMGYLLAAAVVALVRYRRADPVERRRLGVLAFGSGVGAVVAGVVAFAFWRGPETSVFASPWVALSILSLLVIPLSFSYAVLRHRLFGVGLIIRQGVRYALARRLLLSVVPALAALMLIDVYVNRDRVIQQQVAARAPLYGLAAVFALLAVRQRQRWLVALDRRFFRERYDAQRLLRDVVEDVKRSQGLAEAAPFLVGQIAAALHPQFVTLLAQESEGGPYLVLAAEPISRGPAGLPADSKVAALARAVGGPLDLSRAGETWVASHLPPAEQELIAGLSLDLVVPIDAGRGRPAALLALGVRRSEEPYAEEDRELLGTVAENLALLEGRSRPEAATPAAFTECRGCGTCYDAATPACPADGQALAPIALPRVVAGRYRLDRRLGRGGMGVVYAAFDVSLGRRVAVKVLREDLVHDAESAAMFEREARVSAMFTHPNVITVHDFGVVGGSRAFLVLELLEGARLRDEIDRGPIDGPHVLSIMRGVCSAVEAAHRRQLVHRDLKPENVFLARIDAVETPKVLDFGIARVRADQPAASRLETGVGTILGTPRYMAPEQLRGGPADPSWDVWALGVIAYEMLTGAHPFADLVLGIPGPCPTARPPAGAANGRVPPPWKNRFERWFAPDPAARPASAGEFFGELTGFLERS
jgi:serine/threonine-protein kinase